MSEKGCHVFPIITDAVQKEYEKCSLNSKSPDLSPNICGYYGRACRQMDKDEGANRMLCDTARWWRSPTLCEMAKATAASISSHRICCLC